ncbi:hypothetical protein OK016_28590 [Vibrio chagasii]|nr:hypothetical protein [Vibrio chagasii]
MAGKAYYHQHFRSKRPYDRCRKWQLKGSTTQGVWEDGVIDYKGIKRTCLAPTTKASMASNMGYDEMVRSVSYVWNRTSGQLITFFDDAPLG